MASSPGRWPGGCCCYGRARLQPRSGRPATGAGTHTERAQTRRGRRDAASDRRRRARDRENQAGRRLRCTGSRAGVSRIDRRLPGRGRWDAPVRGHRRSAQAAAGGARPRSVRRGDRANWRRPVAASSRAWPAARGTPAGMGRLFELLRAMLERLAARKPVLWVTEDVQWADQSTRHLLMFLARNLRGPAALLLTYRGDAVHRRYPLGQLLAELHRHNNCERVELAPLTAPELAELLTRILGYPVQPAVSAQIMARSGNNPSTPRSCSPPARVPSCRAAARSAAGANRRAAGRDTACAADGGRRGHQVSPPVASRHRRPARRAPRRAAPRSRHPPRARRRTRWRVLHLPACSASGGDLGGLLPGERRRFHAALAVAIGGTRQIPPPMTAAGAAALAYRWHAAGDRCARVSPQRRRVKQPRRRRRRAMRNGTTNARWTCGHRYLRRRRMFTEPAAGVVACRRIGAAGWQPQRRGRPDRRGTRRAGFGRRTASGQCPARAARLLPARRRRSRRCRGGLRVGGCGSRARQPRTGPGTGRAKPERCCATATRTRPKLPARH